ncbi:MAG: hypothetical protein QOG62_2217 [Thermoleophilaceae bacterium]|jgi:hypothetical protein|nr:hypothetical protein [Thermoleophilaceae bacterium]
MSTRKDQKEELKAERLAREKAAQAGAQRKRLILTVLGGLVVVAAVVAVVVFAFPKGAGPSDAPKGTTTVDPDAPATATRIPPPNAALVADLDKAAAAAGCEVKTNKEEGSSHVETPVTYKANPPTSGNHFPVPAEDGSYTKAPPVEQQVHALEHGRIYMQYLPSEPATTRDKLQALFDEDPYHMILAPNSTQMPYKVAATAWNQVLGCPAMNDGVLDAIRAFREKYRDQGPEFIP